MTDGRRLLVADLAATSRNWALPPDGERLLRAAVPNDWTIHVVSAPTSSDGDGPPKPSDEVMEAIARAEVYVGFGIPRMLFAAAKQLRWVHSAAAGVGSALHPEMRDSDVILTNSAGIHAIPIAEYVVAGVLYFLRGLDFAVTQQHRAEWNKTPFVREDAPLAEMDSRRVLIVGTGGLGSEAAMRLTALGATCVGVRRRPELGAPEGFERVVGLDALDHELPRHNVIVLAAPQTDATRNLLTAERLAMLPSDAIVVNVARGALVDEVALAERLAAGALRGAVLDVFGSEPLPETSPFWRLGNVLVTPHVSPVSPGRFWPRQLELFLDNWQRYREGRPLRNVVDKCAGY